MFRKCLKYDLKAFYKIWLIAAAVVLLLSVVCGFGIGGMIQAMADPITEDESLIETLWTVARWLIGLLSYFVIIYTAVIFSAGTSILMCIRYYRHFFTDQGYLTFTLPVKRSTLFWSKATSSFIYSLASSAVIVVAAVTVMCGIGTSMLLSAPIRDELLLGMPSLFSDFQIEPFLYTTVLLVMLGILSLAISFASWMMQYFIITIAATLFRKLKILTVIVAYYILNNIVLVPIVYICVYYFLFLGVCGAIGFQSVALTFPLLIWLLVYVLILLLAVIAITAGLALAHLSIQRLERKLNLA